MFLYTWSNLTFTNDVLYIELLLIKLYLTRSFTFQVQSSVDEEKQMYPSELDASIISTENILRESFENQGIKWV